VDIELETCDHESDALRYVIFMCAVLLFVCLSNFAVPKRIERDDGGAKPKILRKKISQPKDIHVLKFKQWTVIAKNFICDKLQKVGVDYNMFFSVDLLIDFGLKFLIISSWTKV